jgi:ubiquinone/menaquinone biosynthesis C-methylase UbiE
MRGVEQIPWLYDAMFRVFDAAGVRRWRDALIAKARGRTLEIGCGTGRNLPRYTSAAIGVDPSVDALRAAKKRSPATPMVCASVESLPFRDGAFDTVVSSLVFCSVRDVPRGLGELRRVLAPGGAVRFFEHVRARRPWAGRLQDWLQPAWTWVAGGCHPNRDTERAVREAGFELTLELRESNWRLFEARPR